MNYQEMTLQEKLRKHSEDTGLSYARLSDALICSPSVLSQWNKGIYSGDVEKLESKIENYLKLYKKKISNAYSVPYISTINSRRILEMCEYCHSTNGLGIISGYSGVGKTFTIKKYKKETYGVVLVEADYSSNKTELFRNIAENLGFNGESQFSKINRILLKQLKNTNTLIIIDEAENLNLEALDSLRRLRDKLEDNVGLLLVGEPRLIMRMASSKESFARMYNRIDRVLNLDKLSVEETEMFVKAVLPESADYITDIYKLTRGITRSLVKLIKATAMLAEVNERKIDADIIDNAGSTIFLEQ